MALTQHRREVTAIPVIKHKPTSSSSEYILRGFIFHEKEIRDHPIWSCSNSLFVAVSCCGWFGLFSTVRLLTFLAASNHIATCRCWSAVKKILVFVSKNVTNCSSLAVEWRILPDDLTAVKYIIRGAFNMFPEFCLQAFNIAVDSWKFAMLLLYILWDDWPIFMISGSNQQLQQQLEYALLKPDCHSCWISKMQSGL